MRFAKEKLQRKENKMNQEKAKEYLKEKKIPDKMFFSGCVSLPNYYLSDLLSDFSEQDNAELKKKNLELATGYHDIIQELNFIAEYKEYLPEDTLIKIWILANNQWKKGYKQGKYNPDFN
jgi:hypothetical protein